MKPIDECLEGPPINRTHGLAFLFEAITGVDLPRKVVRNNDFRFFPGKRPEQRASDVMEGSSSIEVAVDAEHTVAGLARERGDAGFQLVTGWSKRTDTSFDTPSSSIVTP